MKLINIILGILILAAAGTGLYFAQQLHVKRYQVKIRGDEMATQAQKLLKSNDDVLGLKFKDKVQPEMLHHQRDAAETANALRPLSEQHKAFMDFQTINLEKMQTLMKTIGLEPFFNAEKARLSKTIADVAAQMKLGTETLQNRNEGIIEEVVDLGKGFAIDVDRDKLTNIDDFSLARADFESMNAESKKWFDQLSDYERNLDAIADFLTVEKPDFGDQKKNETEGPYQETFKQMITIASKTPIELGETLSEIETLNSQITEKEETSKAHDAQIKSLKDAVALLNQQITDLRAFLVQEWPDIKPWNYATIIINITDVNDEGSRVTLDWGKSYKLDGEFLAPTNTQYIVALAGNQSGEVILGKIEIDNIEYDKATARVIQMPKILNPRGDPYMPRKEHAQVDFTPMPLYVFDASKVLDPIYRSTVGKILSISDDNTFAVINWGKSFKTTQTATNNHFNTPLLPKVALAASCPSTKTPTGNLLVTRVEDSYAIANVVNTPVFIDDQEKPMKIKVGDFISIVPADIYKIEEAVAQTELLKRRQAPNTETQATESLEETNADTDSETEIDEAEEAPSTEEEVETLVSEEPTEEIVAEQDVSTEPLPTEEPLPASDESNSIVPEAEIQKEMPVEKQKESKGFWNWLFGSTNDADKGTPTTLTEEPEPVAPEAEIQKEIPIEKQKESKGFWANLFATDDEELTPETQTPSEDGEIEQLPEVPAMLETKTIIEASTLAPQVEKKSEILKKSTEPTDEEVIIEEEATEETPNEETVEEEINEDEVVKPEDDDEVVFNQPVRNMLKKSEVLHATVAQKGEDK